MLFMSFFSLGGKVNVKDTNWLTPLHYAAARGHDVRGYGLYYFIICIIRRLSVN